jgi:hypothetical protein
MFIFGPSTIKSIYFFPSLFLKVIFAWRGAGSTCHVHVEVGPMSCGYLLPLSHSSFLLPNISFSLFPHPYPERRSSRVADSNNDKLVQWRKTRGTTTCSCDGACRAIRTKGSCGRARTTSVVEQEEREIRKTQSKWDPPSHVPSMWDSSSHYAKTTL